MDTTLPVSIPVSNKGNLSPPKIYAANNSPLNEFQNIFSNESANPGLESAREASSKNFLMNLWNSSTANQHTAHPSTSTDAEIFVKSILQSANNSALRLKTTPEAIIAVAALETGWGKHIATKVDGSSSNNLFGIKAYNRSSNTEFVMATTTEYINQQKVSVSEPFRSYQTRPDSVEDFANFLLENPRYSKALAQSSDQEAFIDEIHKAGYATDPMYAAKVKQVMRAVTEITNSMNRLLPDIHQE